MINWKPLLVCLSLLASFSPILRAQWTDAARVSVLTCESGEELYAVFGHSAIRIQDLAQTPAVDVVFNYGTFQFNDGFYARFLRGELIYTLSTSRYHDFEREYFVEGRGIRAQRLDLTPVQIAKLAEYLRWNSRPENRDYKYTFFYDNCSTRILDVLRGVLRDEVDIPCPVRTDSTFRQLLWPNLGRMPAVRFGMDVVLGMPADAALGACGDAYLPDHLFVKLSEAELIGPDGVRPLVSRSEMLLPHLLPPTGERAGWPVSLAWMLLLVVGVEAWLGRRWLSAVLPWVAGVAGLLMAGLWFATAHTDTRMNLNLLWAFPGLLLPWRPARRLAGGLAGLYVVVFAVFFLLEAPPQLLHHATFPLALALVLCLNPWKK
jgi:hypothetical protein